MIAWVWLNAADDVLARTEAPADYTKPACGNCGLGIPREVALIAGRPFSSIDWGLIDFEEMWPCPNCGAKNLAVLSSDPPPMAPAGQRRACEAAADAVLGRVLQGRTPVIRPSVLGDAA